MKYKVSAQDKGEEKAPLFPSCRFGLTMLATSGVAVMGLLRLSLTISLVCMVGKPSVNQTYPVTTSGKEQTDIGSTDFYGTSFSPSGTNDYFQATKTKGEFQWPRQYQGYLLSAYFYGFCLTQFLGGYLAGRFGGKHVLGMATLVSTIATLLTPVVARFNMYLFIALRALLGLASGVIVPSAFALLGLWVPPLEQSLHMSILGSGFTLGSIVAAIIPSNFCLIPVDNGWPLTFYFSGVVSFVYWILWNIFAFSSPYDHPRISEAELNYIKSTTRIQSKVVIKRKPFPLWKALSTPAVIALIAANVSTSWFGHTQATTISLYLRDVLHFDIRQNGLYTILPSVFSVLIGPPIGRLADCLRSRSIMSTVIVRKCSQGLSNFGGALLILGVSFVDHDLRYAAVAMLIALTPINNMSRVGFLVNVQDIAPRYSGEILGISNTLGAATGILAPIVVGHLTTNGAVEEWRMVFYITVAILVVGGSVFVIFAKGELIPWAKDDTKVMPVTIVVAADCKTSSDFNKALGLVNDSHDGQYDNCAFRITDEKITEAKLTDAVVDRKEKAIHSDTHL